MRFSRGLAILSRGTFLALAAVAAAFLAARFGFRRDYYAAALLPLFMTAYALTAWFLYLRDDGFIRGSPGKWQESGTAPTDPLSVRGGTGFTKVRNTMDGTAGTPPGGAPLDLTLFAPRDGGLVERAPGVFPLRGNTLRKGEEAAGLRGAFLCAAVELGLLATALYFFAGLGTAFFL